MDKGGPLGRGGAGASAPGSLVPAGRPPQAGLFHTPARFSTEFRPFSTHQAPARNVRGPEAWAVTAGCSSVGVDQLANRGDVAAHLVVEGRLPVDLVVRVEDGGVVPASELGADPQQ